jgi:hypothetical protein
LELLMRPSKACQKIFGGRLVAVAILTVAAAFISAVGPTHAVAISGAIALPEAIHLERTRWFCEEYWDTSDHLRVRCYRTREGLYLPYPIAPPWRYWWQTW